MRGEERKNEIEAGIKILMTFIPGVGSALGSFLNDKLAERKEERINNFLEQLYWELEAHKKLINSHFIRKVDFLDVFEATTNKIANERSEEKRSAFKNILLTGILSASKTFDEIENQMRILDQLNGDHIYLLRFFKSPKRFSEAVLKIQTNTIASFFRNLLPGWDSDYIRDHLYDLEINRLIEKITDNLQTMMSSVTAENFSGTLTSRGMTFVSFILNDL